MEDERIYRKERLNNRTFNRQIGALYNMGSELEEKVNGITGKADEALSKANEAIEKADGVVDDIEQLNEDVQEIEITLGNIPNTYEKLENKSVSFGEIFTDDKKYPSSKSVKDFVNSSIASVAANFCGNWQSYAEIPSTVQGFIDAGYSEPRLNDYLVVNVDETHSNESWRYKYNKESGEYEKSKWVAEYKIGSAFTAAQQAAIDSGITAEKVTKYDNYDSRINNKQDILVAGQGIDITGNVIKSTVPVVSVSESGTATDVVNYITVDGVQKKIGAGVGSIEWGNITGDIENQDDIIEKLSDKQDKLTEGRGININDNEISSDIPIVSVSDSGTSTDEIKYITIDGVEKKLAGGSGAEWGGITGEINDQIDLKEKLDNKQEILQIYNFTTINAFVSKVQELRKSFIGFIQVNFRVPQELDGDFESVASGLIRFKSSSSNDLIVNPAVGTHVQYAEGRPTTIERISLVTKVECFTSTSSIFIWDDHSARDYYDSILGKCNIDFIVLKN